MQTPAIDVVRAALPVAELRATDTDGEEQAAAMPTLEVRFSAFNTWYEVDSLWEGTFIERTVPGSFKQTIRDDLSAMKCLYDHGFDPQIGNKVLGAIESLSEDADSPVGLVPLFDTTYNRDLLPGLEKGVYGSSFRMRVTKEAWDDEPKPSDYNPKGLPERTIQQVRLFEFGPVTFPANPDSTATLRSLTDSYYEQLKQRDQGAYDAAVRAAGRIPTDLTGRPRARSAGGGDSDPTPNRGTGLALPTDDPRTRDRVLRALGVLNANR
jgi:HK97 family phage prohead protease